MLFQFHVDTVFRMPYIESEIDIEPCTTIELSKLNYIASYLNIKSNSRMCT